MDTGNAAFAEDHRRLHADRNHNAAENFPVLCQHGRGSRRRASRNVIEEESMRMRKVDVINVPAGGVVELERRIPPDGHRPHRELKAGEEVRVTQIFAAKRRP